MKRRTFLRATTLSSGGLMLGFSFAGCKDESAPIRQALELPDTWHDINTFIKIGNNGVVTIYSPNPEIGQNVKTSMPMIVAEELGVDWQKVLVEQAGLNTEGFHRQVAGGSQSIRKGWTSLREAGAAARQMLVNAAAERWQVLPAECPAADGIITGPNGQTLGYGEVASEAAQQAIPTDLTLKNASAYKVIGTDRLNVDGPAIVTGKPLFGIDTRRENMVYATILRPPAFGQNLVDFDDTAARAVSGVIDVVRMGDKVGIIASSTWPAIKAKRLIKAQWEDHNSENTALHDQKLNAILEDCKGDAMRSDGDVAKTFQEADEVVSKTYHSPFLPHSCMEPMNFFADATGEKVIMHGPIQTPAWARSRAAKILDRPEEEIDVSMTRMGGGFGRRLYGDFSDEAVELSALVQRPVQLQFTREDDMYAGTYRPAIKYKIEASLRAGKITGYRLTEAAVNSNMYGLIPHFFPAGAIPNLEVRGEAYQSNISTGAWRAPYTNFLAFAEQSFFDELADKLGQDAVALRLDLLESAKAVAKEDEQIEYDPSKLQGVLRLAAEKANWAKARDGVYQGVSAYYSHNTHVAEVAEVTVVDGVPRVERVICAVDCGIVVNPVAANNQVQGAVIDGIGHAMYGEMTFDEGRPSVDNFGQYRLIRNAEAPDVEVYFVDNDEDPTGLGEPALPPAGGAVANAIFKATGRRMYRQPFIQELELLG